MKQLCWHGGWKNVMSSIFAVVSSMWRWRSTKCWIRWQRCCAMPPWGPPSIRLTFALQAWQIFVHQSSMTDSMLDCQCERLQSTWSVQVQMHARAWLAHGACKFYRSESSHIYIFKATSAPPRAGTTGRSILSNFFTQFPLYLALTDGDRWRPTAPKF